MSDANPPAAGDPPDDDRTIFQPQEQVSPKDESPEIPGVRLQREIARGGMGVVYQGNQDYLDREVAVKVLSPHLSGPEFSKRFQREAKILAGIKHPNIVGCHTAGQTEGGMAYLVMEFVDGPNLKAWIAENGALEVATSLRVARAIAAALHHANEQGVIHRDVKAENVLLETTTSTTIDPRFPYAPKLVDLGLARMAQPTGAGDMDLTSPGAVMGTPSTMSPEQFDDPDSVDFRTDIYGLGCVLFRCLTGRAAFDNKSLVAVVSAKKAPLGPNPCEVHKGIPAAVGQLVSGMLAADRNTRPESYTDLIQQIDELLTVRPGPRAASAPPAPQDEESGDPNLLRTAEIGFLMEGQQAGGGGTAAQDSDVWKTQAPQQQQREPTKTPSVAPTVMEHPGSKSRIGLVALLLLIAGVGLGVWQPWQGGTPAEEEVNTTDQEGGETPGSSDANDSDPDAGQQARPPAKPNAAPTVAIQGPPLVDIATEVTFVATVRDEDGDEPTVRWRHLDGTKVVFRSPDSATTVAEVVDGVPGLVGRVAVLVDDGHGHQVESIHSFTMSNHDPVWFLTDGFKEPESPWEIQGKGRWGWDHQDSYHFVSGRSESECVRELPGMWRVAGLVEPMQWNDETFSTCGVRISVGGKTFSLVLNRSGAEGENWRLQLLQATREGGEGPWQETPLEPAQALEWQRSRPQFFVELASGRLRFLIVREGAEEGSGERLLLDQSLEVPVTEAPARFAFFNRQGRTVVLQCAIW